MDNGATAPFISINETHIFVFPMIDFNGKASGVPFSSELLKLPSIGDWWVWGMLATRVDAGGAQMAAGSAIDINIYDTALSQYWWSGGSLLNDALVPLRLVAGKAGNPGIFSEGKFIRGGTQLALRLQQRSGVTPAASSLLSVALIATLHDSAKGNVPMVPSLSKNVDERKGEHYKVMVQAPFATANLAVGGTRQFVVPLNKNSAFIMQSLSSDQGFDAIAGATNADPQLYDPLDMAANVLVNVFDTRTTWKFASPTGAPISMLFGKFGARQFAAPSFFYMQEDQNLAIEITNNSTAALAADTRFVFDGWLQDDILGERVR